MKNFAKILLAISTIFIMTAAAANATCDWCSEEVIGNNVVTETNQFGQFDMGTIPDGFKTDFNVTQSVKVKSELTSGTASTKGYYVQQLSDENVSSDGTSHWTNTVEKKAYAADAIPQCNINLDSENNVTGVIKTTANESVMTGVLKLNVSSNTSITGLNKNVANEIKTVTGYDHSVIGTNSIRAQGGYSEVTLRNGTLPE